MTNRELQTILSTTKNERRGGTPHDVWVSRNRGILLMQVRNTTDVNAKPSMLDATRHLFSIFMPMETMGAMAHGMAVFILMVGAVLGGGLASAQLYANATPGQMLYSVKLAVERTQLLLAPNDEYETNLHARFADNRIDEVAQLAEQGPSQQALVPAVLDSFDKEIAALAAGLDAMRQDNHDGVVETAKLMERKMAVYQNELRKAGANLDSSYHSSLAVSHDLVDGTTLKAIAVIVDSHLANEQSVSRTVVVTKFEERIQQAEANFGTAPTDEDKPTTVKAKAAIAEAKKLLKDENYKAALTKIEEVAQLTKEADAEAAAKAEADKAAAAAAEAEAAKKKEEEKTTVTPEAETTSDAATNTPVAP